MLRLPSLCVLCNQYHSGAFAVCLLCTQLMVPLGSSCIRCARPLADPTPSTCGQCIQHKPFFDQVIAGHSFEEPLRTLLHEFKYNNGLYLNRFLIHLMLKAMPHGYNTECFIPVPMHPDRLRIRGFNQSAELTKHLARALKRPYDLELCKKIVNTPSQAQLNEHERLRNLRSTFQVKPSKYKHITLVDDLMTTGSTANEIAKTLKQNGVQRVDVWCCARVGLGHTLSVVNHQL